MGQGLVSAKVSREFPNRVALYLIGVTGPLQREGKTFDPATDLSVYNGGRKMTVSAHAWDPSGNRYLLYLSNNLDFARTTQVIHHVPSPPFYAVTPDPVPSDSLAWDLQAVYTQQGPIGSDTTITVTATDGYTGYTWEVVGPYEGMSYRSGDPITEWPPQYEVSGSFPVVTVQASGNVATVAVPYTPGTAFSYALKCSALGAIPLMEFFAMAGTE